MRDYSMNGADGQRAVQSGLATADWYRSPVPRPRMKELMRRSDRRAIIDTALWLGLMLAFAWVGVVTWLSGWSLLAFAAYGVLYGSASDSRWHECGHGTAFKTASMNTVVYHIACFMIMRDPTVWRWSHTRHHTDTIIVGRDPEISIPRPPRVWKLLANYVGLIDVPRAFADLARHVAGRLNSEEPNWIPATEHHRVFRTARIWALIYVAMIAACVATRSILPAMLVGLPRLYGAWHHVLTGMTQHGGLADNVIDHRLNSRSVRMNPISRFIYWNMHYHVEHHMFPMVPFHALPALHREIAHDLPPMATSMWAAYKELVPAVLRQRTEPDFAVDRSTSRRAA